VPPKQKRRRQKEWSLANKIAVAGLVVTIAIFLWREQHLRTQTNRPWIVISHVTSPGGVSVGTPLKVVITFKNTASVPARNVQVATIVEWLRDGNEPNFSYDGVRITGSATVGPSGDFLQHLYPTKDSKGEIGYLVEKDFNEIVSRSVVLFVHGHVSYEDHSGKPHWTDFCYWLSARATGEHGWNACSKHNDIDAN
jgi:hypothetical protein